MEINQPNSSYSDFITKTAITDVNKAGGDLYHAPASKIENGVWYLDYRSWNPDRIPKGVNVVNLFVSGLDGQLEGFSDPQKLKDFIKACHAQGIQVKMSVGGHGGKYDNCWDELNGNNSSEIAQKLVDFCHTYGLDGIDFDYEENQSGGDKSEQEKYVGQLIQSFKNQDPNLLASLCTCADTGTWSPSAKIILDQTKDASGASVIDHLYIMSYSGTTVNVEQWASDWSKFLEKYKLPSSATTVGIASNSAYDADAIAEYAAKEGFSTMIWNYDPTIPNADDFPEKIHDDYYPEATYKG